MDKARFFSDNAAPVHPAVWEAMRAADSVDTACNGWQHKEGDVAPLAAAIKGLKGQA